jgi:hypothetical protein
MKIHDVKQGSDEWLKLRLGRPTASEFSRIIQASGKPSASRTGYACELAAERYAGIALNTWSGNLDLDRGRFLEEDGLRAYAFQRDAQPELVGFITDDEMRYGCSPDALIDEDGGCEVKCVKAEHHVEAIMRFQEDGTCDPKYVQQVQGCLLLTGRKWWDLIHYHAHLPMLVIRCEPIPKLQAALLEGIAAVLKERDEILAALIRQRDVR